MCVGGMTHRRKAIFLLRHRDQEEILKLSLLLPKKEDRGGRRARLLCTSVLLSPQRTYRMPKDIHVEPQKFAAELINRLKEVLRDREAEAKLEERLKRVRAVSEVAAFVPLLLLGGRGQLPNRTWGLQKSRAGGGTGPENPELLPWMGRLQLVFEATVSVEFPCCRVRGTAPGCHPVPGFQAFAAASGPSARVALGPGLTTVSCDRRKKGTTQPCPWVRPS